MDAKAKKAIILLSGGLDSATTLAIAKQQGYELYAISFAYGQRHEIELEHAQKIAATYKVKEHKIIPIDLKIFGKSALTDDIEVPKNNTIKKDIIPITYVPARNTIFLSFALAFAEVIDCFDIFIGVNAVDYSGYPDCRPKYIKAFEKMANLALAQTVQNKRKLYIHAPLIKLSKKEIINKGMELGVDYSLTISCYDPDKNGNSCGSCDACNLRLQGFSNNNTQDPIPYSKKLKH